jgi:hypothetical protein
VRANASAGFSIVSWNNPTSGAFTVGHGLGVAPQLVIHKPRSASSPWFAWHVAIPGTSWLNFSDTSAVQSNNTVFFAAPTSTVINLGSGNTVANYGSAQIAYCFAPVVGYSAMGSYTGNGSSTDGPFVFCNFRPKFLLIKRTDTSGYPWVIVDAARDGYNLTYKWLEPNSSSAEQTTQPVADADFLSNGFKLRGNGNTTNQSSGTYIYFAVAESPFNYARAR